MGDPFAMSVVSMALTAFVGVVVTAVWRSLVTFVREQREVNRANAEANRAVQKMELYALFEKVVERGEEISPEEFGAGKDCFEAYEANGGNGAGHLMWQRIEEHARIVSGGHIS